jgi:hypothetical protein
MASSVGFKIGHESLPSSEEKWSHVLASLGKIQLLYDGGLKVSGNREAKRTVEQFFEECHALAELLDKDPAQPIPAGAQPAWEFRKNDPALRDCSAMCNTSKHGGRDGKQGEGKPEGRIVGTEMTPTGCWRFTIAVKASDGTVLRKPDALDLAERCVRAWRRYFADNTISEPAL